MKNPNSLRLVIASSYKFVLSCNSAASPRNFYLMATNWALSGPDLSRGEVSNADSALSDFPTGRNFFRNTIHCWDKCRHHQSLGVGWGVCFISSTTDGLLHGKMRLETRGCWNATYLGKRENTGCIFNHWEKTMEAYWWHLGFQCTSVEWIFLHCWQCTSLGHLASKNCGNCQAQQILIIFSILSRSFVIVVGEVVHSDCCNY